MQFLKSLNPMIFLKIGLVFALVWLTSFFLKSFLQWLATQVASKKRLWVLASIPLSRLLLLVLGFAYILFGLLQPSLQNLIALMGAVSLAVGFAFKDYISSIIAGIVSLYEVPFRMGDWISVEGIYGEVRQIGLRSFEIVTPDDNVVVVPFIKFWDKMIFNSNDGTSYLQCCVHFYLDSDHDGSEVVQCLQDVGLTSPYLQIQKPVQVSVTEKPWGSHYKLKAYPIDPRDQFLFMSDLTLRGRSILQEKRIAFAKAPLSIQPTE